MQIEKFFIQWKKLKRKEKKTITNQNQHIYKVIKLKKNNNLINYLSPITKRIFFEPLGDLIVILPSLMKKKKKIWEKIKKNGEITGKYFCSNGL